MRNLYKASFAELRSTPVPSTKEKELAFSKVIANIHDRHSGILMDIAKGAHELRKILKQDINAFADHEDIQTRLSEFYQMRISNRTVSYLYIICLHYMIVILIESNHFSLSDSMWL